MDATCDRMLTGKFKFVLRLLLGSDDGNQRVGLLGEINELAVRHVFLFCSLHFIF